MSASALPSQASAAPSPPDSGGGSHRWLPVAITLGLAAFGLIFVFTDVREVGNVIARADPWLLLAPVACTLLSYVVMALSYQGVAHAAGTRIPFADMLRITFVANTANYLVATGGASGFAVRLYFFSKLAIRPGNAVVISLAQGLVTNITLLLFVIFGFAYLASLQSITGWALVASLVLLAILCALALLVLVLLVNRRLRRRTLFILANAVHWFMHRFFPSRKPGRMHIWRFQRNLNMGIEFILARKRHMVLPTLWIFIDWVITLEILHAAFWAIRYPVAFNFVVVGFAIGVSLSLVSFIPGGLGIMEGSMAAVFANLGVPLESALVAVLIFRLAYYVLPLVISVFFFHGLFFQSRDAVAEISEIESRGAR